jgi:hypothetical protein
MLKAMLAVVAIATGLLAAGGSEAQPKPEEEVLFLRTGGAVSLFQTSPTRNVVTVPDGVPATDWSAVVQAARGASTTTVSAFDSASGQVMWSLKVDGILDTKVVTADAGLVALGNPAQEGGYLIGRQTTTLAILQAGDPNPRMIELEGNYEPEAFSTDGQSLFVVEYLPPRNPTSYRVRRLDLLTEEVEGVYTVDAHLQEAMQGTARIQAASSDGRRLYTLYTLDGPDGTRRAFVHVLSLDELWAHCVDLPASFADARENRIGLAVAPDGKHVYAAEASTGTIAEIDTGSLAVTRTTTVPFEVQGGDAHAAVGDGGTLYLGKDTMVMSLDIASLSVKGSWTMPDRITGIQPGLSDNRVYVGLREEILNLDTATGRQVDLLDPEGEEPIDQLGESTDPLEMIREVIECAC